MVNISFSVVYNIAFFEMEVVVGYHSNVATVAYISSLQQRKQSQIFLKKIHT